MRCGFERLSFHGAVRVSLAVIYALALASRRRRSRAPIFHAASVMHLFLFIRVRSLAQYRRVLSRNKSATLYHSLSDLYRSLAEKLHQDEK